LNFLVEHLRTTNDILDFGVILFWEYIFSSIFLLCEIALLYCYSLCVSTARQTGLL